VTIAAVPSVARSRAAPADFLALAKPRIVAMVAVTAGAGYVLGLRSVPLGQYPATTAAAAWWVLLNTIVGTALVAGGASALNQVLERDVDALMRRTAKRPLPAGRLRARDAGVFAWIISALGALLLLQFVNALTALLAVTTLVVYVFAYTPLKRRSHIATLVGAIPGALPILGGWTAAGAPLDARAAVLFAILFVWQLPHFLALSWMYRDDYARAGLRMVSTSDGDGGSTFRLAALTSGALLPISLAPAVLGVAGLVYFVTAVLLSLMLLWLSFAAARNPTPTRARRLFLGTLVYLPALLAILVAVP
jgi:heme o synthase